MDWQQYLQAWQSQLDLNRQRTLAQIDRLTALAQPLQAFGFRPGPGRAHVAWQWMHIGITEGLFATVRLFPDQQPMFAELAPRFQGGSTPDDQLPELDLVRDVLSQSRSRLLAAVASFGPDDLHQVKVSLKDGRQLTLQSVMNILAWHEPHHQGQAHLTLNLYQAAHGQ